MTEQVNQKLLAKEYWPALQVSLAQQVPIGFGCLIAIDGGMLWYFCSVALAAYWGGLLFMLLRRPHTPTKADLLLIRWGFLPLLILSLPLIALIWRLKGI